MIVPSTLMGVPFSCHVHEHANCGPIAEVGCHTASLRLHGVNWFGNSASHSPPQDHEMLWMQAWARWRRTVCTSQNRMMPFRWWANWKQCSTQSTFWTHTSICPPNTGLPGKLASSFSTSYSLCRCCQHHLYSSCPVFLYCCTCQSVAVCTCT